MSPSPGTLLKLPKPTTCQSSPTAPNENAAVRLLLLISYNSRAPVPPLQNHIRLGAVIVEIWNLPLLVFRNIMSVSPRLLKLPKPATCQFSPAENRAAPDVELLLLTA